MEKVVNSYETLFIVNPTLAEDDIKAAVEKFTALIAENGTVGEIDEWGKRRLAYPINDITEGYYVLVNFTSESSFPAELERRYNIDENIMRGIVIKLEAKKAKA
ncbi:MAG: 30S ribosomal protein S6 [Ruminococcaceae bacterium]|nr:30S ribosomal protein S6 [Oscillospiraceae bacterium]